MPKYHIYPELGSPRKTLFELSAKYRELHEYEDSEEIMGLTEGGGSLVLRDFVFQLGDRVKLDKLHLSPRGSRLKFLAPHVENSQYNNETGPRADLWWFDGEYARLWVEELERWKDPEYRERLIESLYGPEKGEHFNLPYRRRQLRISDGGLDGKIEEAERFVQKDTHIREMTEDVKQLTDESLVLVQRLADNYVHEGKRDAPKVIVNPQVQPVMSEIHAVLRDILTRVDKEIGPEMADWIVNYWDYAASWENL